MTELRLRTIVASTPLLLVLLPALVPPRNRDACSVLCRAVGAAGWAGGWALGLYAVWAIGLTLSVLLAARVRIRVQDGAIERRTLTSSWRLDLRAVDRAISVTRDGAVPGGGPVRYLVLVGGDGTVLARLRDAAGRWRPAGLRDLIRSAGLDVESDHRTYGRDEFSWLFSPGTTL